MKKKGVLISLGIIVIAAVSLYSAKESLFRSDLDFSITDTSSITQVFMVDKRGNQVTLSHPSAGVWMVNAQHKANNDNVQILLQTIQNMEVKSPVPHSLYNNVIGRMAANAVKVEIYQRVFLINVFELLQLLPVVKKTQCFYVGDNTQDLLGTYMIREGAEYPYIMHIPGFNGYLTTRFSPLEKDWRDHTICNISFTDLQSLSIVYDEHPEESFTVKKKDYQVAVMRAGNPQAAIAIDTANVFRLLSSFRNIRYEVLANDYPLKDSVLKTAPFAVIDIQTMQGQKLQLKAYKRKGAGIVSEMNETIREIDPDRFNLLINNQDFVLAQYYVFDRIFTTYTALLPKP